MSASDSDCSLDWLSSGREDKGSLFELDCEQAAVGTATPPPTSSKETRCWPSESCRGRDAEVGGVEAGNHERSDCSSSSVSVRERDAGGCGPVILGRERQPVSSSPALSGASPDEKTQQTRKRLGSSVLHKEQEWADDKDRLFAYKCSELQRYMPPLSSILNGLRSGRYRGRLSSFQESVAMDRIQRIMGVLQNRCTGERYVGIILKVEEMLKNWFPNVKPREPCTAEQEEATPAKKQKVVPATAATQAIPVVNAVPLNAFPLSSETGVPGACSATHTKWLHTSPICSSAVELTLGRPPPSDKDVTQDNAVSSSTDSQTDMPAGRPPPGKINAPCLERLLKSTESIITCRSTGGLRENGWS